MNQSLLDTLKRALEELGNCYPIVWRMKEYQQAKTNLTAAIAELEKAEPSAEVVDLRADFPAGAIVPSLPVGTKLYLHPPTDEKMREDAAGQPDRTAAHTPCRAQALA